MRLKLLTVFACHSAASLRTFYTILLQRVMELNEIATKVIAERNITSVDLYATMTACGDDCKACKPHCGSAGYTYLTEKAIVPAIKKALAE